MSDVLAYLRDISDQSCHGDAPQAVEHLEPPRARPIAREEKVDRTQFRAGVVAPLANGAQLVAAAERVDQSTEPEEQERVANGNADGVDEDHDNAECMCVEEARRLAVDG